MKGITVPVLEPHGHGVRDINAHTIDVDAFEYEDIVREKAPSIETCKGYALVFPGSKTSFSDYPFALHGTLLIPWELKTQKGMLTIVSTKCTGTSIGRESCASCQQLSTNTTLEGIMDQIENGSHCNSTLRWNSFNELREKIHEKNQLIEFYRLRGLNQARKLLGNPLHYQTTSWNKGRQLVAEE